MNQAFRAGKTAAKDEHIIKRILDETGAMVSSIPMEQSPPETGAMIYKRITEITGNPDPYCDIKQQNIQHALSLYPELKIKVHSSKDPLLTAIRLAVAGNVIDLGIDKEFDIVKDIEKISIQDFAIFDYDQFKSKLACSKNILYIGDNSGEGVFDKILIEQLELPVIFAVRDTPIINDITVKEAEQIGLDKVAKLISSGSKAPGTILDRCSDEFLEVFNNADMIISKGQGNYESLSDLSRDIFYMLKAKCRVVARHLNVKIDDIIFKYNRGKI